MGKRAKNKTPKELYGTETKDDMNAGKKMKKLLTPASKKKKARAAAGARFMKHA